MKKNLSIFMLVISTLSMPLASSEEQPSCCTRLSGIVSRLFGRQTNRVTDDIFTPVSTAEHVAQPKTRSPKKSGGSPYTRLQQQPSDGSVAPAGASAGTVAGGGSAGPGDATRRVPKEMDSPYQYLPQALQPIALEDMFV